jgi:hypothetical protein
VKEVRETRTVWSLGAVSYNRAMLSELWLGTRLDSGERVTRQVDKPLPDILPAELPPPDPDSDDSFVLTDRKLEDYERIAEPPVD